VNRFKLHFIKIHLCQTLEVISFVPKVRDFAVLSH
jgi:hypothetical protein